MEASEFMLVERKICETILSFSDELQRSVWCAVTTDLLALRCALFHSVMVACAL